MISYCIPVIICGQWTFFSSVKSILRLKLITIQLTTYIIDMMMNNYCLIIELLIHCNLTINLQCYLHIYMYTINIANYQLPV